MTLLLALACATGPPPSATDSADTGDTADTADTGPDPGTLDQDGDGYRPLDGDCDDRLPHVYPGAPDFCDGLDQDCDGEPIPDGSCGQEGDATLSWRWSSAPVDGGSPPGVTDSVGDADGDGLADVMISQTGVGDGPLYGASLVADTAWLEPDLLWSDRAGSAVAAGDTDADGLADAWWISYGSGGKPPLLSLQRGATDGFSTTPDVEWEFAYGTGLMEGAPYEGDFDADGAADLLVLWNDFLVDEDAWVLSALGGSVGFLGGSDFDAYPHTLYDMEEPTVTEGLPTTVGDLDGDGADEVAVTLSPALAEPDSLAIVSGLELAVGGGVFSTLAVRSGLSTAESINFDLTAPALGANTDADGDGYDDLEVGVYFPERAESVILYASGSIPDGSLDDAVYARIENMAQSPWLLYRGADLDGDGAADSVAQHCLLPTTRFAEGGTFEHADVAGPCLGLAGYLRVLEDMTGDGLPEWVFNDLYGSADGHNRVLIVEGFPIPWDDPGKW